MDAYEKLQAILDTRLPASRKEGLRSVGEGTA